MGVNSVIKWVSQKHLCMVTRWSLERVWESTYDLRNEATVLVQVKEQQLYSAARPTGRQKIKRTITWLISYLHHTTTKESKSNHHVLLLSHSAPRGALSVPESSMH